MALKGQSHKIWLDNWADIERIDLVYQDGFSRIVATVIPNPNSTERWFGVIMENRPECGFWFRQDYIVTFKKKPRT